MSGRNDSNKNGFDLGGWLPVIILFCIPYAWPVAVFLLLRKLAKRDRGRRSRHPYDIQREQRREDGQEQQAESAWDAVNERLRQVRQTVSDVGEQFRRGPDRQTGRAAAGPARPSRGAQAAAQGKKRKGKPVKAGGNKALTITGAIAAGIFGLAFTGALGEFLDSLSYGFFFVDELMRALTCLMLAAGGLAMLGAGIGSGRRRERYLNYMAYIGTNQEVDLAHMAAAFGVSQRKLRRDLSRMLSRGVLPTGYLDLAAGKLVLSEKGYRPPEPEPERPAQARAEQDDDAILREIRQVNEAIPDPVMSAKIDRIGEITGKILDYQRQNPGKSAQLRSFLNYYLPTTLKILRAYAQLDAQGVEGENISAAKARIEGMMDKVVEGFENQLDKLFRDSAMDISSDVAVLEQMLERDGLSGSGQGMTMGG